jgi:hypothetical protein
MDATPFRPHSRRVCLFFLAALVLLLAGATLETPLPVSADAGGWPTATPTLVPTLPPLLPTPVPTVIPTSPLLSFPPTPTYTPVVPLLSKELGAPELQGRVEAPPASRSLSANLLTILPFGITFFVVGAVGYFFFRTRFRGLP